MIRGIHYFSAEVKTKIDVIPRGCFKIEKTPLVPVVYTNMIQRCNGYPREVYADYTSLIL